MSKARSLDAENLLPFLDRHRSPVNAATPPLEPALGRVLESVARFLDASEVRVYLDDPKLKLFNPGRNRLTCVAALGPRAAQLVGTWIHHLDGIPGQVYARSEAVTEREPDGSWTLAVPLRLGEAVCGALLVRLPRVDERSREFAEVCAFFIGCAAETTIDAVRARDAGRIDHLTGLTNESFFHFRLREELKQTHLEGTRLALLVLDIDNFRRINDRYGYWFGSQTIREIGHLLRLHAPPESVVARIGGDAFAIALSGADRRDAEALAHKLRAEIARCAFCEDNPDERITTCVGIATFPEDLKLLDQPAEHTTAIIRLADAAMRLAKSRGRDHVADSREVDLSGA